MNYPNLLRWTGFGLLRCRVFGLGRLPLLDGGDADSPCHSLTKPQLDPQEILHLAERIRAARLFVVVRPS